MDYGTFFVTNIASVTVVTVCMGILAFCNRRVVGMRWFAAAQLVGLIKLVLQGLEGKLPVVVTAMVPNELYLVSFIMQFLGLQWFVTRQPARSRWLWPSVGLVLCVYTSAFLGRISYSANLINLPFVAVCAASAWVLLQRGSGSFKAVSRGAAAVAFLQASVAGYRAVLTNLQYAKPWATLTAHRDPRWTYSLAAAAFLAGFMAMCELWFLVMELQRELAEQARTDFLTGALNRRALEDAALRETARCLRSGHALSMIVLDIDNFKVLNDTRGHAAGDRALQGLVCHIRGLLRQHDMIARTGGEEFAILLPDTEELEALAIAERVRQSVEELAVYFEEEPIRMTICAGVAQLDPATGWEKMMQIADSAMYEAKKHGRNLISARLTQTTITLELNSQYNLKSCRYVQTAVQTI